MRVGEVIKRDRKMIGRFCERVPEKKVESPVRFTKETGQGFLIYLQIFYYLIAFSSLFRMGCTDIFVPTASSIHR